MKELQEDFITCLQFANSDEPLFIFLDSLDQFGPEDNARQLTWLPTVLPSHVKLVVSTLPDGQYECFPILKVCRFSLWNGWCHYYFYIRQKFPGPNRPKVNSTCEKH